MLEPIEFLRNRLFPPATTAPPVAAVAAAPAAPVVAESLGPRTSFQKYWRRSLYMSNVARLACSTFKIPAPVTPISSTRSFTVASPLCINTATMREPVLVSDICVLIMRSL